MKKPIKTVCVYHSNCHDGITALWVVSQVYPDLEAYPGRYDETPELERFRDARVIIVDFSYNLETLEKIIDVAWSVTVLDHHKTAEEALGKLANRELKNGGRVVFDMNMSGALLTWTHFNGYVLLPPPLIAHVSDRDLWRFELPFTREIHASTGLKPLTLAARTELMNTPIDQLIERGTTVLEYHKQLVEQACKFRPRGLIGGYSVPVLACPVVAIISDVGHELCKGELFAATYTMKEDGCAIVSLRSSEDGLDVSSIARMYGGGGHKHAAGFHTKQPLWASEYADLDLAGHGR